MQRNDFRRSLILLRPLRRGMSGHVRLERRTLQGSMRFTVQGAPRGRLHALLLAQGPQGFTAYKLGALTADSRGQAGLNATFDPRNLQGLDLNQYTLVVLVDDGGEPEMVLSGLVNGSREIDWEAAARTATQPYRKADSTGQAQTETASQAGSGAACCCDGDQAAASDSPEQTDSPPAQAEAPASTAEPAAAAGQQAPAAAPVAQAPEQTAPRPAAVPAPAEGTSPAEAPQAKAPAEPATV